MIFDKIFITHAGSRHRRVAMAIIAQATIDHLKGSDLSTVVVPILLAYNKSDKIISIIESLEPNIKVVGVESGFYEDDDGFGMQTLHSVSLEFRSGGWVR